MTAAEIEDVESLATLLHHAQAIEPWIADHMLPLIVAHIHAIKSPTARAERRLRSQATALLEGLEESLESRRARALHALSMRLLRLAGFRL